MYPHQRTPMGNPYIVGIYGLFHPQESLENTINAMGRETTRPCPLIDIVSRAEPGMCQCR